ncbi:MAG: DNA-directed RNA polymerase subunit beta' [Candidatus Nealsonbacteria bacterium RBG_13_36_15]|uniref:DNA-directed RNA polymerase subunit beta' n=1 Tax=Candidatus Nealsonbacteria bacterium RBG_13_36_15 TaxID=1801660 RepID=A0A1G2DVQ7_9BACT|nr:MAG: DNA-directed RNA polymerase subunit beta' [Candidatus Nealsonbacteria bacterium RBG_13_36_15]
MRVADIESITIKIASPEAILSWSHGEVTKPETINYRTQRSEKDGLFCEKIFGPTKDYECYCGKYRRIRYKGVICDKCGVEVTKSQVRRERMGHIKLTSPVSHIWFLRGVPSRIGMVLDIPLQQAEKVIYFVTYIVTKVSETAQKKALEEIEKEYKRKVKEVGLKEKRKKTAKLLELKKMRDVAREEVQSIKPLKIISETEYHHLSLKYGEVFEAGTGAETLRKIFEAIDLKQEIKKLQKEIENTSPVNRRKVLRRLKLFQGMQGAGIRPEWMFLTVLPVLPPDLRPMVQLDGGRYASSDLNDLYRRVINRDNRLKYLLEVSAPEVIVRNEKRMLQEAVDALIDNTMRKGTTTQATTGGRRLLKSLADMLKGKQGRFRQNLLGKRVDYSGRSVIVVGPKLKLYQVGIPKKMALELFKPFVIHKILERELAYNIRGASRLIEQEIDEVWAMLEEVVKNKLVLLNRAPTLHRLGIQAFQPILIEGEAIRVHPLVCKAFNADFDGDQMAVHIPLSEEAQREAREVVFSTVNLLKSATGTPVITPTQDIILGCFWITKIKEGALGEGKIFGSQNEAILAYDTKVVDLRAKIKVRLEKGFIETSVGRILFNRTLPPEMSFVNEEVNGKKLDKIIGLMIEKIGLHDSPPYLDKIKDLGFEFSTKAGISWGMDDLIVPKEKGQIISEAEKNIEKIDKHYRKGLLSTEEKSFQVIETWQKAKLEIEKLVPKTLPPLGPISLIINSGAKGSWAQPIQMTGMKGLVINPAGKILELPVKSSYKEGFDILEYFISTHGARKGTADTALRTATAGYLTRRLVDVAHEAIINEEDCRDDKGIIIFRQDAVDLGQNFLFKILGRVTLEDIKIKNKKFKIKKGEIIDWQKANLIKDSGVESVRVRSPLSCKSLRGICRLCYGWDLALNQLVKTGEAVGIIAAQAIGEPGTQLTMRTFHLGGVVGEGDITLGLPRVEEVFEARPPLRKAVISGAEGRVIEVTPGRVVKIRENSKKQTKNGQRKKEIKITEYEIPMPNPILVSPGDEIKLGHRLSDGSIDLKELFKSTGQEEAQRYIVKEIQKIYVSQGAIIHDKHIEIIVRQMFSRVRIKEEGDTHFTSGEVVEKGCLLEENSRLKKEKKKIATFQLLLLGISKVALTTDSFLSAASFQETSRVLIQAALEGKKDGLKGLKENVIIGKLIPAGSGFRK